MNKRKITFFLALYLFLSSCLVGCKRKENDDIYEVVDITSPTCISKINDETTSPTEIILIENNQVVEATQENIVEPTEVVEITEPTEVEKIIQKKEIILTLDEVALLTIGGRFGNGDERKNNLTNLGYDYEVITNRVNEIMNGGSYTIPDRNTYFYNFGYVKEKVDVYDEFGNREGSLSAYQKFLITDQKVNDMTLVHFQNQTFYLKDTDIKRIADSHLEIDISEQKVYLYIDGELILESDVITGYPGKGTTPGTNLGITQVYSISYNVTFTPEKKSEIFILFNWDGEGFHDAPWREEWEFNDKERYLTHGSDGCTNMLFDDVKVIEENCYLGMPVLTHK